MPAELPAAPYPAGTDSTPTGAGTESVRFQKALFEALAEASLDGIIVITTDGRIATLNRRFVEMWGLPREILETHRRDVVTAHILERVADPQQYRDRSEYLYRHPDETVLGEITLRDGRIFEHFSAPVRSPDGVYHGRVGRYRDITERQRAEDELRYQKSLLEAQSQASIDGMLTVAADGRILSYNQRFVEMWRIPNDVIRTGSDTAALEAVSNLLADPKEFLARVVYLYAHPGEASRDEIALVDGRTFDRYSAPVKGDDGTYYGRVWFFRDVTANRQFEAQLQRRLRQQRVVYELSNVVARAERLEAIFEAAMGSLHDTLGARRASVLLLDPDGVMRFKAWRGLSETYRAAMEGRSPWGPDAHDPPPVLVPDVRTEPSLAAFQDLFAQEGIGALAFIPLVVEGRLLGKVMLYYDAPRPFPADEVDLAQTITRHVAFAIERTRTHERIVHLYEAEQQARRQAEAAVRARDEFLSVAAHELKTPLTSLLGSAQLARRRLEQTGRLEPERLVRTVETIDEQSRKLARLVNQLLDLSRIQAGKLAIDRSPTDVAALVRDAAATAQATTTDHTIAIEAPTELIAEVDALRLEQVLANLLDNAIKYSPEGGPIEITLAASVPNSAQHDIASSPESNDGAAIAASRPTSVQLTVADHGLGIPPEHRPHIFDRFYQAHGAAYRSGMGLGLAICREIVELHGGRIEVDCPETGGTRFVATLPAA
ncbi:MAG: PAS-domain containing protein [Chloroflexi bacterium]|nr:PAS-domain containing protein [Chloroflexota bacterium]